MKPEKRWRSFLPPLPKQINDRDESEEQKDAAVYGIHTARLEAGGSGSGFPSRR